MARITTFIFFVGLFLQAYSQIGLNLFHHSSSIQDKECDTINIDGCYLAIEGERISIDTNLQENVDGVFSVAKVSLLNTFFCMLHLEKTDTIYTVYDSSTVNNSWVYLVDTSFSTKEYIVLVENENDITNKSVLKEGSVIPLCLKRFYNVVKTPNIRRKNTNDNLATTWSCDQCHIIILHEKKEKIHYCPLYNNMYKLK